MLAWALVTARRPCLFASSADAFATPSFAHANSASAEARALSRKHVSEPKMAASAAAELQRSAQRARSIVRFASLTDRWLPQGATARLAALAEGM